MIIPRDSEEILHTLAREYPVIAITGPRQSGKSTLAKQVFPKKTYITFEDLETREYASQDPKGFLSLYPSGAVLDEIQRVPHLFSYIQTIVDKENQMGMFILTGSQQFELFEDITQSLAGRVAMVFLLPFSTTELHRGNWLPDTFEDLLFSGFYPPIYDRKLNPSTWYANYVRTYLERDVRQMIQVRDLSTFQRFVRMCAARTGQLVNFSSLANDCGVTHNTVRSWISILEASFIVYLLKPHYRNFNKRLIKTPKLYFLDSGLAAWLLGIQSQDQLSIHPNKGELFETFVVSELLKKRFNLALEANLYFWRDRTGNEIDIIIEDKNKLIPLEIKAGKTIVSDYFVMLKKWFKIAGDDAVRGWLIYGGETIQKRDICKVLPWKKLTSLDY